MMYDNIIKISRELETEPVMIFFSTGKDSIVCLDLMMKYHKGPKTFVYFYFVEGLEIKERILRWYESRYGITIHREMDSIMVAYGTGKKSYKLSDHEAVMRQKYNVSYIVKGYRKQESMARRGMLAHIDCGIDWKYKNLYPVADWSTKEILAYIKQHKLMLPQEYQSGYKHDIAVPDGKTMLWIKHNMPDDYTRILARYPEFEAMVFRETEDVK
jgi:3'-phosphoadenosine 5'-phosphosulfate sulfotransferase (PAPS reductase)/FAD synthetase